MVRWWRTTARLDQTYGYDAAGRLTPVQDSPVLQPCTTRRSLLDADSNRTGMATAASISYDAADPLLTSGTVYDSSGRPTTALAEIR